MTEMETIGLYIFVLAAVFKLKASIFFICLFR